MRVPELDAEPRLEFARRTCPKKSGSSDTSVVGKTKWYEYAIRFVFGGLTTAIAGGIAREFGPATGGLFLAFPAIFLASATLIEKHEKQEKEKHRLDGAKRGRQATSLDAAGSAMGSIGLLFFALIVVATRPRSQCALNPDWGYPGLACGFSIDLADSKTNLGGKDCSLLLDF